MFLRLLFHATSAGSSAEVWMVSTIVNISCAQRIDLVKLIAVNAAPASAPWAFDKRVIVSKSCNIMVRMSMSCSINILVLEGDDSRTKY